MQFYLTNHFKRQIKKLIKKHPQIIDDLVEELENFNPSGSIYIGHSIYKIRIASGSLMRGKSGGMRCLIYLFRKKNLIVPICLYAKNQVTSLGDKEIKKHLAAMNIELILKKL